MRTVLLIEDDPRIARMVMIELGRHDWGVLWEKTGYGGVKTMESSLVDIVLLDLMLPDVDGIDVCHLIRQKTDIPLLVLTARDAVSDRVKGLDAGADDYLIKPFAMSELLARMRALTRRPRIRPDANNDWIVGENLKISARRHEVRVLDEPVELTKREFAVLEYLMQNAGSVVTRDMILERVWGWGYSGTNAVVDVYIGYLRHKIDWTQARLSIATIRGVGYLIRDAQ